MFYYFCAKIKGLFVKPNIQVMTIEQFSQLKDLIANAQNIVIVSHKNPDGDAIGSSLGLRSILYKQQKQAKVIVPDSFPGFLRFLPDSKSVWFFDKMKEQCTQVLETADLIFVLDFNTLKRIEEIGTIIEKNPCPLVLIDHHPNPDIKTPFTYHRINVSSTSELVYEFTQQLYPKMFIGPKAATCLYAGIVTDTGSFRHNLHEKTHLTAGKLLQAGADHQQIMLEIFDSNSLHRTQLLGYALSEKLQVDFSTGIAYIALSQEELKRFEYKKGDTEGFVNIALGIDGVTSAILLTEASEELTKLSFRSHGNFAVNSFAQEYFGGGGHKNAAGGAFHGNITQATDFLLKSIPNLIKMNLENLRS